MSLMDLKLLAGYEAAVRKNLQTALHSIENPMPSYRGKVRDVFARNGTLWIVATDRVSAFDKVLGTVPFKGALLTEQAVFGLTNTRHIVQNHLLDRPCAQMMVCREAVPIRLEMIVRGFLAGSLLREPPESRGQQYGIHIDESIKPYAPFPVPIITPTTKADVGEHDEPISLEQAVSKNLLTHQHASEISEYALALFAEGSRFARAQGLLLVDTKYEFGLIDGKVALIDEIHTADSSRYWVESTYAERLQAGKAPDMLDKERLRQALLAAGYDGVNLSTLPALTDDMRVDLACHYSQLTETHLGKKFVPEPDNSSQRIQQILASRS